MKTEFELEIAKLKGCVYEGCKEGLISSCPYER